MAPSTHRDQRPEGTTAIADGVLRAPARLEVGHAAALTSLHLIRRGHRDGCLKLMRRGLTTLDRIQMAAEAMPPSEAEFIAEIMAEVGTTKLVAANPAQGCLP